jgi:V8-like Glu-specific endopeptidase
MVVFRTIIVLFLLLYSAQSTTAVFDRDDRISVSGAQGSLYSPIGIVYPISKKHYATGFLVDRCNVLTVKHVVGDDASAENRVLYFSVGPGTLKGKWTAKGIVVANGKFRMRDSEDEPGQGRVRDWLLLRLDRCLGDEFGYLRPGDAATMGQVVEAVGFPRDRSLTSPTLDPSCKIRASVGGTVLHDCASRPGASGGPIVRRVRRGEDETLEVIAIHTAGVPDKGVRSFDYAYSSIAVPIQTIFPAIEPFLNLGHL